VVNFNDDFYLDLDKDFTSSVPELKEALERIDSRGSTALYDAIIGSLDHVKKGVKDKKGELLPTLKIAQARKLIQDGVVAEGMIPKVECCIEALKGGVAKTHIVDGRVKHAVVLEAFTKEGVGTEVVQK
jgi:carbamate kinase